MKRFLLCASLSLLAACAGNPVPTALEGHITYAHRPMSDITKKHPEFWFRDELSGNVLQGIGTSYDPLTSAFRFWNLPDSNVGISVTYHLDGKNKTLPGNFDLWLTIHPRELSIDCRKDCEFPMEKIMRLRSPADNATILPDDSQEYPSYESPTPFKWEALEGAASYHVTVSECRDPGHTKYVSGCDRCTTVLSLQALYPYATISLPPSQTLTHYEFKLVAADSSNRALGKLMTTYDHGHGWDYRFRIRYTSKRNCDELQKETLGKARGSDLDTR